MKSSPYENNPYTSSSEAPTQPLPPAPSLPAGRGEAVLALLLALLAAFTANSLLYGGLALGSALGIFGIFTMYLRAFHLPAIGHAEGFFSV